MSELVLSDVLFISFWLFADTTRGASGNKIEQNPTHFCFSWSADSEHWNLLLAIISHINYYIIEPFRYLTTAFWCLYQRFSSTFSLTFYHLYGLMDDSWGYGYVGLFIFSLLMMWVDIVAAHISCTLLSSLSGIKILHFTWFRLLFCHANIDNLTLWASKFKFGMVAYYDELLCILLKN